MLCYAYNISKFVTMNDELHLKKSKRIQKPTRKLVEQLESEEWIKSQEALRYVLDDGESVISQIKSVSTNPDGSEHSVKSKFSKTSSNGKVGQSNVHTNQLRMYEMPREPQLDIEHRSEHPRGADLSRDLRHVESLPYNHKTTPVPQHYILWSRASNNELGEQTSSHEALSEHVPPLSLMKPSKMLHDEIPTEFTEYRRATSEHPGPLSRQSGHLAQ